MPRYFFHVHYGHDIPDMDGVDLPNMQAVRAEAISAAGEMLRDLDGAFSAEEWRMEVAGENGRRLLTLRFRAEEPE